MQNSNPIFSNLEKNSSFAVGESATKAGITTKTFILLAITLVSGFMSIYLPENILIAFLIGGALFSFVMVLLATYIPKIAAPMSILYAVGQGVTYGLVTYLLDSFFPGIGLTAMVGTASIFTVMLILYTTGLLRGSSLLRAVVLGSLIAILIGSLVISILSLTNPAFVQAFAENYELALFISIVFIVLGAFMLTLDFDRAERIVAMGLPKNQEWVASLGFMVTLIWIYVNILRFLVLVMGRNK
ncbi:Bax inhibitor-1/YccA family protein [Acholeplasma equirhinis]|uniref:Bax inhibitor-1/YccA family protein n=1 Tax=Acholeplasma equirhinis TaxID=555393 RepID=UPI00197AD565|nr:Bax inhibitor-1/YccA family protein [Acholeplasma equirhinis]MBN3490795.1 Bax inhibitor-1/YccA family protein [Acholeplasma equirhinis]